MGGNYMNKFYITMKKKPIDLKDSKSEKLIKSYFSDLTTHGNINERSLNKRISKVTSLHDQLYIDNTDYSEKSQKSCVKINCKTFDKRKSRYIPNLINVANERRSEKSFMLDCKEARDRNLEESKYG